MLNFLKKFLPFLKDKTPTLSKEDVSEIKAKIEAQLSKVRKNQKVIQLEIDLRKKVSKALAEVLLKQMEKEYSEKLGKKVTLVSKNGV